MFEKRKIEDNKAFKQLAINDITRISAEATKNNQYDLANRLRDLMNQIEQTPITASTELPFFYVAIRRYCMDITDDLNAKNFKTAEVRMKEFENVVKELGVIAEQNKISLSSKENKSIARVEGRLEKFAKKSKIKIKKDYSPTNISVETLYPAETIAELRISGLQDRLDRANKDLEALRKSKEYNQLIKAQIQAKKQEIDTLKQLVAISNKSMFRDHQVELIKSASEEVKREYAYQTKKYDKEQQEILEEWEAIKAKHGISLADEASMEEAADNDLEEKFYELMHDVENINEELKESSKEMSRILRKVKDLNEDMQEASGTEKNMIADQIRDYKIKYQQMLQKQQLLQQRKADSQAAYQVLARDKDFQEVQERYAGISTTNLETLKSVAGNLSQKIDEANQRHQELNDISQLVIGNEIQTSNDLDTDFSKAGDTSDLDDFLQLAEQEGN